MSYVLSRLNFCSLLYMGISEKNIAKLQKVQNSAVRILFGMKKRDHISPKMKELGWLSVKNFLKYRYLTMVYKCLNSEMPYYLCQLLQVYTPVRNLRSSTFIDLEIPFVKGNYGSRSFSFLGPMLWNNTHREIRNSPTLTIFCNKLNLIILF